MLLNAPKIPSCHSIWKSHVRSSSSRLCLSSGKTAVTKFRSPKHGHSYRYYCKKGPCPEPPQGVQYKRKEPGGNIGTIFAAVGIGTTAVVVAYAKYDPDFRRYIEEQLPAFNEFIKITTQEEYSYSESWEQFTRYVSKWLGDTFTFGEQKGSGGKSAAICPPPPSSKYEAPKAAFQPLLDETESKKKEEAKYSEIRVLQPPSPELPRPEPIVLGETQKPPADIGRLPDFHPKNIVELEKEIAGSAEISIKSFNTAACALRDYSEEVFKILDSKIDRIDPALWSNLRHKSKEKENAVNEAEKSANDAGERARKLRAILEDPAFDAPDSLKVQAKKNINKMLADIEKSKKDLQIEKDRTSVTERYWQRVEEARRHFQDELEILFPSLRIEEKKYEINPGELDLFVLHAYSHVLFYQKELSKLETLGEYRLKQALDKSGSKLDEAAVKERVSQELEKERRELFEDLQKKILTIKAEQDKEIRQQMKRQIEAAEDHLHDMLEAKEREMARKNQRVIEEQVETERNAYKMKLAEMVGRMKGIEAAFAERVKADRLANQAHVLFGACQSLYRALRSGVPGIHWSKQLRPLDPEISALQRVAGKEDQLVQTVLKGIPQEAKTRGVYPEIAIRERFLKVERVARMLALIPDQGASMPRYLASYLQSLLLFRSVSPIPSAELEDQPVDLSRLDTYDILQRARYWVDRGDFAMSLRYMNLLKGAPRQISCEWMKEARIFLETQQAADALMAYAAATGLQYT